MRNQEILEKAIQKAIDGGWKPFGLNEVHQVDIGEAFSEYDYGQLVRFNSTSGVVRSIFDIIFNHDFAKALWSEMTDGIDTSKFTGVTKGFQPYCEPWKNHLQQMVVAENPIDYLGEHLDA